MHKDLARVNDRIDYKPGSLPVLDLYSKWRNHQEMYWCSHTKALTSFFLQSGFHNVPRVISWKCRLDCVIPMFPAQTAPLPRSPTLCLAPLSTSWLKPENGICAWLYLFSCQILLPLSKKPYPVPSTSRISINSVYFSSVFIPLCAVIISGHHHLLLEL